MIDDKELKAEKDYLKAVLYILQKKIGENKDLLTETEAQISRDLKYAWDNKLDDNEWAEIKLSINRKEPTSLTAKNRLNAYGKMLKSAYFARIDFDDGDEVLPIYIGIATLEDGNSFYVYDWRAPISSMFYDFELGEAYFDTPNGRVNGKITLKRQYKIEGDKITQVFDTSMQVVDKILQEMLQGHATDKMRNIVNTIQKEQNKVIRKLDSDVLVVSGPAGSGKTSVAMHRVAYLLYAYKESLANSNVLILSPNEIFSNYISNVLPEIGEDNVYQTTFLDFISAFLTEFKIKGTLNDVYEYVYSISPSSKVKPVEYNSIRLKLSNAYINLIETFISRKKYKLLAVEDVVVDGKVVIDKSFLEKFADNIEVGGLTFKEQGQKIIEKILLHLDIKFNRNRAIRDKVKKALESNLNRLKPKDMIIDLYSDRDTFVNLVEEIYNTTGVAMSGRLTIKELTDVFDYTQSNVSKGILPYEDCAGYMYLKERVVGFKTQRNIRQVVIDEGQDYSAMQYRVLSSVFKNAQITVLGDINQCILPFNSYKTFDTITNILKEDRVDAKCSTEYLSKTYRSTTQINTFCKKLIGEAGLYNQVERNGDEVEIICDNSNFSKSKILEDALKLKTSNNSLAIVTATEAQSLEIKDTVEGLKLGGKFKFVTKRDRTFNADKIMVIPAYLAKGLEFDIALIFGANAQTYPLEFKQLFYVACTRALHKLNIYYTGELTPLITNAGKPNGKHKA